MKHSTDHLALFSGHAVFDRVRSTSNLVKPDFDAFCGYLHESYDRHWLTNNGPATLKLEACLREIHNVRNVVSSCSGLWALVLTLDQIALPGKTEVIMPSLTYRRMADVAYWTKRKPNFCDVDPISMALTPATIEASLTEETAAIIAPHPIVNTCDPEEIEKFAQRHGIPLLFDSVEAANAVICGKFVGGFGDAECFSLHASKFINGFEGGYITTNNDELAAHLQEAREFGFESRDRTNGYGINAKLNDLHAAMALAGLDDIPRQLSHNKSIYRQYQKRLDGTGFSLVEYSESELRTFKNILVEIPAHWSNERALLLDLLHAENILARPYYFPPLHLKEANQCAPRGPLYHTMSLSETYVLLPSGYQVTEDNVDLICDLLEFLDEHLAAIKSRVEQS